MITIQIFSGFFLAFYYTRGKIAWNAIVEISREVNSGWLLRIFHRNIASFVFLILFIHFFRGFLQRSFYLKGSWLSGWMLILIIIATAFFGYVLPWGQISFWGATVIINLLRVLPIGRTLVIWLWGGFYVSSFTCRFFYAIHFILPFLVLLLILLHLFLLHFTASSVSGGFNPVIKIKFSQLFLFKDMINLSLVWLFLIIILSIPDWAADPVNFVPSDLSNSPVHIQPEWYFLHLYAILRSIPNKLGGLVGFTLAILTLSFLSLVFRKITVNQVNIYNNLSWIFIWVNRILLWLGIQPVENPYIVIGQILTIIYFLILFSILILDKTLSRHLSYWCCD